MLAASVLALVLAGPASAGSSQESIFQDDRVLFDEGPERQAAALDQIAFLGADTIHANVYWREYAPAPTSEEMPSGFDGADPAAYPPNPFDRLDALVRAARERGIDLLLSPTGPAPEWAVGCSASEQRKYTSVDGVCRPNAKAYGDFVRALGRRYSGEYLDENGPVLPRVRRWSLFNEPNLNSWIAPQIVKSGKRTILASARIYRDLVNAATPALRGSGHRSDQILIGETAPIGAGSKRAAPVDFYLALFCMDSRGRRFSGQAARDHGCTKRKRLDVNGAAHHPYTRGAGESLLKRQNAKSITIANPERLERVLTLGARQGMIRSSVRRSIYFTEFGVSSKPPAKRLSVPLSTQAEYLNWFDYLAYRRASVKSVAQFALEDDPNVSSTFQTGISFRDGQPKPAYGAYRLPIYVVKAGRRIRVFGQTRAGGSGQSVEIQNRGRSGGFKRVRTVKTGRRGYFSSSLSMRSGTWRLVWVPNEGGLPAISRVASARTR